MVRRAAAWLALLLGLSCGRDSSPDLGPAVDCHIEEPVSKVAPPIDLSAPPDLAIPPDLWEPADFAGCIWLGGECAITPECCPREGMQVACVVRECKIIR